MGQWARINKKESNVRLSPDKNALLVTTLTRHTAVQITGGTSDWYRVLLPTGQTGYITAGNVESVQKPLKSLTVATATEVLEEPLPDGTPINLVKASTAVQVLANYNNYVLVKTQDGTLGWLLIV